MFWKYFLTWYIGFIMGGMVMYLLWLKFGKNYKS